MTLHIFSVVYLFHAWLPRDQHAFLISKFLLRQWWWLIIPGSCKCNESGINFTELSLQSLFGDFESFLVPGLVFLDVQVPCLKRPHTEPTTTFLLIGILLWMTGVIQWEFCSCYKWDHLRARLDSRPSGSIRPGTDSEYFFWATHSLSLLNTTVVILKTS